jgi:hypothetical protein
LCRDVGLLAAGRDAIDITVDRQGSAIDVRWPAVAEPRVLILAEMYRPDWVVTASEANLSPRVFYGGLLGVALPARVSAVRFEYRPAALGGATAISVAAVVVSLALLVLTARRPTARPSASVDTSRSL